jgi:2'-hydroxyisoflavone reductase
MNLLVIGGTRFVGRHIVQAALSKGHQVTLFHRGQSGGNLFEDQVERVLGDRNTDLSQLTGRYFDAVIDTCAYRPNEVKTALEALGNSARQYLLISTISVYDQPEPGADENARTFEPLWEAEAITGETYGPLKVACEKTLESWPGEIIKTTVRPGLVVGPFDHTDRFTYWLVRAEAGGTMAVPDAAAQPIQFIDARDLAEFVVRLTEQRRAGVFNAVGPEEPYTFGEFLEEAIAAGRQADMKVISTDVLESHGIRPWVDLPLYMGDDTAEWGMGQLSHRRAVEAGLQHRDPETTIAHTLAWARSMDLKLPLKAGISPEQEERLLADLS